MTAINHALTGTVIGLLVGQPLLAVPLAVGSHYVCDALPHFGTGLPDKVVLKTNKFRDYLVVEAILCFLLVVGLATIRPEHWLLAAICAFTATAPDLLSIKRYFITRRGQRWQPTTYGKFAKSIQWFERPIGGLVELAWFIAAIAIIIPFIR
jgi:hypothetical protein